MWLALATMYRIHDTSVTIDCTHLKGHITKYGVFILVRNKNLLSIHAIGRRAALRLMFTPRHYSLSSINYSKVTTYLIAIVVTV